jgi:hypothetical protein
MLGAYSRDGNCYYILQSNDPAKSFTGYGAVAQSATHTCPASDTTAYNTTAQVSAVTLTDQAAGAHVQATGTTPAGITWDTHF